MTRTASEVGRASRAKGAVFERAVTTAIRPWFPDARRSRDNGTATTSDTGDIIDAGPVWWSCKDVKASTSSPPALIAQWQREAIEKAGDDMPVIVVKRSGQGNVLISWAWMRLDDVTHCAVGQVGGPASVWLRMELFDALRLLHRANYAVAPQARTTQM